MSDEFEVDGTLRELEAACRDLVAGQARHETAVSGLESEVATARAEVVLTRDGVSLLRQEVDTVTAAVGGVASAVSQLDRKFNEFTDHFNKFTDQYAKDQVRAAAEAELTQLTLQWHSRFEQRRRTRALARGLVHTLTRDALERGVVDRETVEACAQERMLEEPTYWLAPALVALAARHRGESQRGRRARSQAYSLDAAKSNLFFALTCSRFGELSEAARWMDRYLHSLDPYELDEDFQIVLDAVACNELGHDAHSYARQAMKRWAAQLDLAQAPTSPDAVSRHLWKLRRRLPEDTFPELRMLCGDDWQRLCRGWELASVPMGALDYLRKEFTEGFNTAAKSHGYAESALESLIDRYDPEEAALNDRMDYLRLVIAHKGDTTAAATAHTTREDARGSVDLRTLLVTTVFVPDAVRLGAEARLLVLRTMWPTILATTQRYTNQAGHLLPGHLALEVQEWSGIVPADPAVTVDAEPLVAELTGGIRERTGNLIEAVRLNRFRLLIACVLTVGAGGLGIPLDSGPSRVACAALCLVGLSWAVFEWRRVPKRREELSQQGTLEAYQGERLLRLGLEQREDFFTQWMGNLRSSPDLAAWGTSAWRDAAGELNSGDATDQETTTGRDE